LGITVIVHQFSNPIEKAAAQLRLVSQNSANSPTLSWDANTAVPHFVKQTADIMADKPAALTLQSVYSTAPPYTGIGRPQFMGISLNSTTQQHGGHPPPLKFDQKSWDDCACVYGRISIFNSLHCTRCI